VVAQSVVILTVSHHLWKCLHKAMRLYIEMQPLNFTLTLLFYFLFFTSFLFTFHLLPTPSSFHAASSGVDRAGTDPWTGQGRKAAGTATVNLNKNFR
jgi:hypothetical protein